MQIFKQDDSRIGREMTAASFDKLNVKILDGFCLNRKMLPCRGFILKPKERLYVSLKNGVRDF